MNAPAPRKRKPASTQASRFVRASVTVDAALHGAGPRRQVCRGWTVMRLRSKLSRRLSKGSSLSIGERWSDRINADDRPGRRTEIRVDEVEAA